LSHGLSAKISVSPFPPARLREPRPLFISAVNLMIYIARRAPPRRSSLPVEGIFPLAYVCFDQKDFIIPPSLPSRYLRDFSPLPPFSFPCRLRVVSFYLFLCVLARSRTVASSSRSVLNSGILLPSLSMQQELSVLSIERKLLRFPELPPVFVDEEFFCLEFHPFHLILVCGNLWAKFPSGQPFLSDLAIGLLCLSLRTGRPPLFFSVEDRWDSCDASPRPGNGQWPFAVGIPRGWHSFSFSF